MFSDFIGVNKIIGIYKYYIYDILHVDITMGCNEEGDANYFLPVK